MDIATRERLFTVHDVEKMVESGILAEDDRVELLGGRLIEMSPIGPDHASHVKRLNRLLARLPDAVGVVGVQDPVILDDVSMPVPDLALSRPQADFYSGHHPTPPDILLLIEVSDSSLRYDRDEKLPRYASALIPEVWIVDVAASRLERYWRPRDGLYRNEEVLVRGQSFTTAAIPDVEFAVVDILGEPLLPSG